jgi:hypothetical protein
MIETIKRWLSTAGYWPRRGRLGYWLWQRYGPLGRCDTCRAATWHPVAFYVKQDGGWTGHYYCEQCGPSMLAAAEAIGELVSTDAPGF